MPKQSFWSDASCGILPPFYDKSVTVSDVKVIPPPVLNLTGSQTKPSVYEKMSAKQLKHSVSAERLL